MQPAKNTILNKQPTENPSVFNQFNSNTNQPAVNAISNNRPAVNAVVNKKLTSGDSCEGINTGKISSDLRKPRISPM